MTFLAHILILVVIFAGLGAASEVLQRHLALMNMAIGTLVGVPAFIYCGLLDRGGLLAASTALLSGIVLGMFTGVLSKVTDTNGFSLVTFSTDVVMAGIFVTATAWTGGPLGRAGITMPCFVGVLPPVALGLGLSGLGFVLASSLLWVASRPPVSSAAAIVATSSVQARGLMVPDLSLRVGLGALCGFSLSLFGVVLSGYVGFVSGATFGLDFALSVVAVSLLSRRWPSAIGPLAASFILVGAPELLRLVGWPPAAVGYGRTVVAGIILAAAARGVVSRASGASKAAA